MTLYEINQNILECFDFETGEILDADKLTELSIERDTKIENIALYVKNLTREAAAIREEEKALAARRKAKENRAEQLKNYLSNELQGEKFETAKACISFRKSEGVIVTNAEELVNWLEFRGYDDYISYTAPTANLTEVKRLIKQGETPTGATIEERTNINIK
jgi:hypothetical protein